MFIKVRPTMITYLLYLTPDEMVTTTYTFDEETGELKRIDSENFQEGQLNLKPFLFYKISNSKYLIYGGNKDRNTFEETTID
jgi:hypothetical protein